MLIPITGWSDEVISHNSKYEMQNSNVPYLEVFVADDEGSLGKQNWWSI